MTIRTKPPFRADHVGSILRPARLKEARARREKNEISAEAIRAARQWAINDRVAVFHVHTHGGRGVPGFSGVDIRENARFVPNFVSVAPHAVLGALVLSDTAAFGQVWLDRKSPQPFITHFAEVGMPIRNWRAA